MRVKIFFSIIFILILFSCSSIPIFRDTILIKDVVAEKDKIDSSQNPAEVFLLKNNLAEKNLLLENITVKDIVISTNVDYDFCVLADVKTEKGLIECYIYTKDIRKLSKLKKGATVISVKGEFNRYFSVLDNYFTKVEIVNSKISIEKE